MAGEDRIGHLSLGSNVGDREENMRSALAALGAHGVEVEAVSGLYETEPVGEILDQPDFLNAAARISTALGPEELLDVCKAIEVEEGRMFGGPRHGPRPIDIDILLLGDLQHRSDRLTIPHADLTERRFVLVPLLELAPDLVVPGDGRVADRLDALGTGQEVRVAGPPLDVRS
jgi:2-amino-4-hydroxy-6-hydroxymethyldihydropteridine diphosphokinase